MSTEQDTKDFGAVADGRVVKLALAVDNDRRPDPQVIEYLEMVLARAKSGETTAVAVVEARTHGGFSTSWTPGPYWIQMVAGASDLVYRLHESSNRARD